MTVRVQIADDHQLLAAGLAMLIGEIEGYEVVASARNGIEALEQAGRLKPDLVIMDIQMPGLSGLDCLARIREELPDTRVLMLSMHANSEHVARALSLGAHGYLLKDAAPAELELAVRTVANGNVWLSAAVSSATQGRAGQPPAEGVETLLTPRQQEVLKRLAEGASVKEIAFELDLSAKTVETYRAQIMERLKLHDLPSLVRYAIRTGLISL
ncbi:MAG TPA: response regulator transcription factor [Aromatoleum sp.]|uniref:response regulator transcription factor n=1 Tax=Aromatoleum sp. TaxID=2307007 RepID=UPI002B498DE7|nr:response regulator transcription factor [Aromatoleum sp.]HJV24187.1 response regulator transcription factor [Aromatoleum sp.]